MTQNHKAVIWNFDYLSNPPDGYLLSFQGSTGLWIPVNIPLGINRKLSPVITASSYTVQAADDFLRFDSTTNLIDGYLPATPTTGKGYTFADVIGHANANNITVIGNGYLISGNATFTLTMSYQTVTVVFNGIGWNIV